VPDPLLFAKASSELLRVLARISLASVVAGVGSDRVPLHLPLHAHTNPMRALACRLLQALFVFKPMGCGGSTPEVPKGAFKIEASAKAELAPDKMWYTMGDFETAMQVMLGGENLTEEGHKAEGGSDVGKAKRTIIHEDRHYEEKLVGRPIRTVDGPANFATLMRLGRRHRSPWTA
jgi:hypothetical protein